MPDSCAREVRQSRLRKVGLNGFMLPDVNVYMFQTGPLIGEYHRRYCEGHCKRRQCFQITAG
jgi:hypothetical protein